MTTNATNTTNEKRCTLDKSTVLDRCRFNPMLTSDNVHWSLIVELICICSY